MDSKHLWVFLGLLALLVALFVAGAFRYQEGFQVANRQRSSLPRCPPLYTFFNDSAGASFCCRGTVNPYTHSCSSRLDDDVCAFVANTPDPRNPNRTLRLCSDLVNAVYEEGSNTECPANLPHYATDGITARCCKSGIRPDGSSCVAADIAEEDPNGKKTGYCVAVGEVKENEKRCSEMKMVETVRCPDGFQTVRYVMGERESKKYGKQVMGVTIPTCYRVNESCIPDAALDFVSTEYGAFKDRMVAAGPSVAGGSATDWSTWKWSCSGLAKQGAGRFEEVTQQQYP